MADQDFDEYSAGWEAIVDSTSDPELDSSWAQVFTTPSDRESAAKLVWMLRDLHAQNPAVRNVGLYGRPSIPQWTEVDAGPKPAPEPVEPPAEPAPEVAPIPADGAEVQDDEPAAEPEESEATVVEGPPETPESIAAWQAEEDARLAREAAEAAEAEQAPAELERAPDQQ